MQQRPRDVQASAQSAGQGFAAVVGALAEAERVEQFAATPIQHAAAQAEQPAVQLQSFVKRHQIVGARLLQDEADSSSSLAAVLPTEDRYLTPLRGDLAAEHLQDGGLARPVRPEQRDDLAALDCEVDVGDAASARPGERGPAQLSGKRGIGTVGLGGRHGIECICGAIRCDPSAATPLRRPRATPARLVGPDQFDRRRPRRQRREDYRARPRGRIAGRRSGRLPGAGPDRLPAGRSGAATRLRRGQSGDARSGLRGDPRAARRRDRRIRRLRPRHLQRRRHHPGTVGWPARITSSTCPTTASSTRRATSDRAKACSSSTSPTRGSA